MAFDFPASPTVGQAFTPAGGATYTWNGYAWVFSSPMVYMQDSAPASPAPGALWFKTDTGILFVWYVDPSTSQWVSVGGTSFVSYDSPTFTGDPKAPTPPAIDNDTSVATTAFVKNAALMFNYLGGLTLANNSGSPTIAIDIATGSACSDDNTTMMSLPALLAKNFNAAWSVGMNAGGLDVGSSLTANTWYHVFLIMRPDTGVVDVLASTSATSPTMPANYTKKRRIGSFKTNASAQILAFLQNGDEFWWMTLPSTWETSNAAVAVVPGGTNFTVNTPLGVRTTAIVHASASGANAADYLTFRPVGSTAAAIWCLPVFATAPPSGARVRVPTNLASQINVAANSGITGGFYMSAMGWIDNRGK